MRNELSQLNERLHPSARRNQHQWFPVRLVLAVLVFVAPTLVTSPLAAQNKYSANHPDVEAMVEKSVEFLRNDSDKQFPVIVLRALAIVQAGKRYQQEIPSNDPLVSLALKMILERIPNSGSEKKGQSKELLNMGEVYVPALATILLAEVDKVKYKGAINQLIKMFEKRQEPNGSYTYLSEKGTSDTSQTQFVALALYVVSHHGFEVDLQVLKRVLHWIVGSQQPGGFWIYKLRSSGANDPGRPLSRKGATLSMQAAGLGTAYLLADLLQLSPRKKSLAKKVVADDALIGLPRTVTVYVKPVDSKAAGVNQVGPLVDFDMGRLGAAARGGNAFLEKNFTVDPPQWTFYYLYALERYAWFREQTEGHMGSGKLANWYDVGVKFMMSKQEKNGAFVNSKHPNEKRLVATSLAVLFLVRSSEVISIPGSEGELAGGIGFPDTELNVDGGQLVANDTEKNLSDMMSMLGQETSPEQLEALNKSLKKAVGEFKDKDEKSRGEIKSFLRTMISANNYYRRKIAVRFLAGEQDMDNVPALIFALGDPDFRVCIEAQDGLRLISRRIDSLTVSGQTRKNATRDPDVLSEGEKTAMRFDFKSLKKKWTEWFLKIRPDAELLD